TVLTAGPWTTAAPGVNYRRTAARGSGKGGAVMKRLRAVLAFVAVAALAGVAYDRQREPPAGSGMAAAAADFLAALTAEQKAKTVFAFDDKERLAWDFVPLQKGDQPTRKGLRLEEMNPKQRE